MNATFLEETELPVVPLCTRHFFGVVVVDRLYRTSFGGNSALTDSNIADAFHSDDELANAVLGSTPTDARNIGRCMLV